MWPTNKGLKCDPALDGFLFFTLLFTARPFPPFPVVQTSGYGVPRYPIASRVRTDVWEHTKAHQGTRLEYRTTLV